MVRQFLRSDSVRHSRLGKGRRKLLKWRRPRGRHSKIRRHRFSYPVMPAVGYGVPRKDSGKIKGLNPILIHNVNELERASKGSILIIARIGSKKREEVIKKAKELNLPISNIHKEKS